MLGSTKITAVLGAAPPADSELPILKAFVRAATDAGLALLLIEPGTKLPVDMRTTVTRNKEDKLAREAAQAAGQKGWAKVRSRAGVHLASTDSKVVCRYLDAYRKEYPDSAVNFAINVGLSGLVVVDADTPEQVAAFMERSQAPAGTPPTVMTPGQVGLDGEMAHKDGGHYYFTLEGLPQDQLDAFAATGTGTYTGPGGYVVMWRDRYVLIPPSVRPEGSYQLAGREYPVPEWIVEEVVNRGRERAEREARANNHEGSAMTEAVDTWAATVVWDDILSPHGWVKTARPDNCGCDVWTAPGVHASPKSATAHDSGCSLGRYDDANAPLHIWTDHPEAPFEQWTIDRDTRSLTKLQAWSLANYDGKMIKACDALGLLPPPQGLDENGFAPGDLEREEGIDPDAGAEEITLPAKGEPQVEAQPHQAACPHASVSAIGRCYSCGLEVTPLAAEVTAAAAEAAAPAAPPVDPPTGEDSPFSDEGGEPEENAVLNSDNNAVPNIAPFDYWRDLPAPEYAIEGLIEHKALSSIIGPPGIGKSTVALDMACSLVTGQRWQGRRTIRQRVLYLPGEGLSGAVQRIRAWELAHGLDVGKDLLLGDSIIQVNAPTEAWQEIAGYVLEHRVGLIIFDTFARMGLGMEENSASDVGKAIKRFDNIRTLTNAGVLVVHHTGKVGNSGRGSSALNGALDTELLVLDGSWDSSGLAGQGVLGQAAELHTTKQKNAPRLREPLPLHLTEMFDSIVTTGPSGIVGDPLDAAAVAPLRIPEPVVETAIRLHAYATRFPAQGVTRGELILGVEADEYTAARSNADLRWKRTVHESVDLALRYNLLETLSGTASGMRYIVSSTTPEAARLRAAQEAMAD